MKSLISNKNILTMVSKHLFKIVYLFSLFFICAFFYYLGTYQFKKKETEITIPQKVTYEEALNELKSEKEKVIFIGRPSCQFCAIVSDCLYSGFKTKQQIFYLSLEEYRNTPQYDSIKNTFSVEYIPAFLYVKNGKVIYTMNCPLDTSYFSVSSQRQKELYEDMKNKIQQFLNGCDGVGVVINEPLLSDSDNMIHSAPIS